MDCERILRELDSLLRREPDLRVFAATDNREALETVQRRYPDVITTSHWYPAPGAALHRNPECPDRLESGVEALVDLYLLGSCDYLVGDTSSSFTYLASVLPPRKVELIDVRPPPYLRVRLVRAIWRRYAASGLAAPHVLRQVGKAYNV